MKNLILFFCLSLSFIGCGEKELESQWANKNFIIDGSSKDWDDFPLAYDEDLKFIYGIANNDTCLYLMARFNDRKIFHQLSRLGFTIWLNESNEKKETLGIHYINKLQRGFINKFPNEAVRKPPTKFKNSGIFTLAESNSIVGGIDIKNIRGLQAEMKEEDGLCSFEMKIPLNKKEKMLHSLSIPNDGKIKICLMIGSLSEENRNKIKEKMPPRGRHREPPNGKSGMRGGRRERGEPPKKIANNLAGKEFWTTLKLVLN